MVTDLLSGRKWFGSNKCAREYSLVQSALSGCHAMLRIQVCRWFSRRETIRRKLKLTARLPLVPSQRIRRGIPLLYSNQSRCLLYRSTETIWSAPVPGCMISPLRPRGNFMYRTFCTDTKYKYCITACLCVSYDSENREKIFPYTAIAGSLL
jgi:hypothetical protein